IVPRLRSAGPLDFALGERVKGVTLQLHYQYVL
ncbi:MAG: hypothetical protein QOJ91_2825, partial [Sphingomonadales bacterium]|nr:hypothetical protein [Sphingomonadales bacterium]